MHSVVRRPLAALALVALAACGGEQATAPAAHDAAACRAMAPSAMNEADYVCALAAEIQAIADALETIEGSASADKALPALKKSGDRIKALKGQLKRLNDPNEPNDAGATLKAGANMRQASKASRAMIDAYTRIAREHPELIAKIGPALEDVDL